MSTDAARSGFFKQLDKLRGGPTRPEPIEVLRLALDAGFDRSEALNQVRRHGAFGYRGQIEEAAVLPAFFSSICAQPIAPVLEYASQPFLLTTPMLESPDPPPLTYVTPSRQLGELTQALTKGTGASVVEGISQLPTSSRWQTILCQAPLGRAPAVDGRGEGFGGEVVKELAPLLAEV